MSRRHFLALILPLLAVLLGFVLIVVLERSGAVGSPPWDDGFARYVRTTLAYEFVGGIDDGRDAWEAYFAGLNAYVQHFDHYALVVPPWELEESRERSSGQYGGIGVRTEAPAKGKPFASVRVTGVKPDGPAGKAGVRIGDLIIGVEGRTVAEIGDSKQLAALIKGERGTTVRLRLRAQDGTEREVELVRAAIDTGSVFGARFVDEPARIGYIRIRGFMPDTARAFRAALQKLLDEGMEGLVLDLRYNNGGLLPQAVEVADAFLDSGIIVRVRGRGEEFTQTMQAGKQRTIHATLPLAVLIHRMSASASEVLAGAIQDHRRGILVGERSWGKFLVQTVEEVPMELGTARFKRTSAIYETPLGLSYQRRRRVEGGDPLAGLAPDVHVATTRADLLKLEEIFDHEHYADWNPDREPPHPGFKDHAIEAAVAVLKGEVYYPPLPQPEPSAHGSR